MRAIELRDTPAGRGIGLARAAADALRGGGWNVQQGTRHSRGPVDLAATRSGRRGTVDVAVRLLINVDAGGGEAAFSLTDAFDAAPLAFALGDDTQPQLRALQDSGLAVRVHELAYKRGRSVTASARPQAPPARAHAGLVRATNPQFSAIVQSTLDALDVVYNDLLHAAIETIEADERAPQSIAPLVHRVDVLHGVVITDAELWAVGDQSRRVKTVRLAQSAIAYADPRWIDIVSADDADAYCAAVTKHYSKR
jgi:hypothetical protein